MLFVFSPQVVHIAGVVIIGVAGLIGGLIGCGSAEDATTRHELEERALDDAAMPWLL